MNQVKVTLTHNQFNSYRRTLNHVIDTINTYLAILILSQREDHSKGEVQSVTRILLLL